MSDPVTRINALTANSRNTWLVMLAALIFVGVTLMQVKPIDFYGVNRATQLPLVNIAVPTRLFFIGAPILITAVYGYFHLYLIRLWDALGAAPSHADGTRLSEAVSPWLVTDAALFLRNRLRQDYCSAPRTMELPSMILNIALAWVAGLVILGWLLWASAPARTFSLSIWPALSLGLALFVGSASLSQFVLRMRSADGQRTTRLWSLPVRGGLSLLVLGLIWGTWERTEGDRWLADLVLTGEQIVERPEGWKPREIARKETLAQWCKREPNVDCKALTTEEQKAFEEEWAVLRAAALRDLKKPGLNPLRQEQTGANIAAAMQLEDIWYYTPGESPATDAGFQTAVASSARASYDFRAADLREVFAADSNLVATRLQGVKAQGANFEAADLSFANLNGASFSSANLSEANLRHSQMKHANFHWANLQNVDLRFANLSAANLEEANLQKADLTRAYLGEKANLTWANLQMAHLSETNLQDAILAHANLHKATLGGANLLGVDLSWANLREANIADAHMHGAILRGADLHEADLSRAILQRADFRGANLKRANLAGSDLRDVLMSGANLHEANLGGTILLGKSVFSPIFLKNTNLRAVASGPFALRFVAARDAMFDHRTDWRNSFLDGTVLLPEQFARQQGSPCQWVDAPLNNEKFYGHWRGWIEHNSSPFQHEWEFLPIPPEFKTVTPIPPPPRCTWKTSPHVHFSGGR